MKAYFGFIIIGVFIMIVIVRSLTLKKQGIEAVEFGKKDKKDLIILPFAAFYLYILAAHAFGLPSIPHQILFYLEPVFWFGAGCCLLALAFFAWTMISFRKSFRVGLVDNSSQGLITSGAFSISRNPIYVCFALMLTGQFLMFSSRILLIYLILGTFTFHRQILKEEAFLVQHYGKQFEDYSRKVRRYL